MAINLSGTNIGSMLVPYTTDDTYATHSETYGQGGYRSVDSLDERNTIPYARRKLGMLVNVIGVGMYKLDTNPNTENTTDANWVSYSNVPVIQTSSDSGNIITLSDASYTITDAESNETGIFNVFLTASSDYTSIRWVLVVGANPVQVSFSASSAYDSVKNARVLLHDKDDLTFFSNTTHVLEFETYDGGANWLVKTTRYALKPEELITRTKLEEAISWEDYMETKTVTIVNPTPEWQNIVVTYNGKNYENPSSVEVELGSTIYVAISAENGYVAGELSCTYATVTEDMAITATAASKIGG